MTEEDRASAMTARLRKAASRAGITAHDIDRIERCFRESIDRRATTIPDQRHPDYLHTARTALVLLEDLGIADADALALATLYDSKPRLTPSAADVERLAGTRAAALAAQLPDADADETGLREMLVTAEPVACMIALAERLDHARHLHLAPRSEWAQSYHRIRTAYLPVALRAHPDLARRYRWWTSMFARRYLKEGKGEGELEGEGEGEE